MSFRMCCRIPVSLRHTSEALLQTRCVISRLTRIGDRIKVFNGGSSNSEQSKRWLSQTPIPCHLARFLLSSNPVKTPPPPPVAVNIDKLKDCDEILLVQKASRREEDGHNYRVEYKYEVKDKVGDTLFLATHVYETYPTRFDLKLYRADGKILVTHKLFQGLSSSLLNMQIMCPGGLYVGSIEEKLNCDVDVNPCFELRNSRDEVEAVVLKDFTNNGLLSRSIEILTPDRHTTIGKISKQWAGFGHDNLFLRIHLPKNMDSSLRAALIGLSILVVGYK